MGCDYYIWIETVIQYLDADGKQQSFIEGTERERGYTTYFEDPDFDEPHDLNYQIKKYGKKPMFENGIWYCLDSGRLRIEDICLENNIKIDSIISIFKFKNGFRV